ncbi:MAG TPA: hypothetical protein VI299_21025 [Polyangiales bacterium]
MMLGPIQRALAVALASLAVLSLVMTARALLESRAEGARATHALSAGQLDDAIVHLRDSARWDAPFNPYAADSRARLEQLAQASESRGDPARALSAYRSLHAAIQATRSFYMPHADQLARADEKIASLMAREPPAPIDAQRSEAERKADYLALLQAHDPNPLGVLLAFLGLVTWVGSAVTFVSWGVDREGRILRAVAKRSVLCLLLGWIAFAVGLRIA